MGRFMKQSASIVGQVFLSIIVILVFATSVVFGQQQYEFANQWGSEGSGPGQFNGQNDVDPFKSFVYVADYDNNRIQVFDNNGTFVTSWGSEGSEDGQIDKASALTLDRNGNIYLVDQSNLRVQKFDHNGNFITKWGTEGEGDGQFLHPHVAAWILKATCM
jgi:tripartite motif-containing protein 71